MTVLTTIAPTRWVLACKTTADAEAAQAATLPDRQGVSLDVSACEGVTRLLLPILAPAAGDVGAGLAIELELGAPRVSSTRGIEWVAVLHGPAARSLLFLKRLESLPVAAPRARRSRWVLTPDEVAAFNGQLFLALQLFPHCPPIEVAATAAWQVEPVPEALEPPPDVHPPRPIALPARVRPLRDGFLAVFRSDADARACGTDLPGTEIRVDPGACAGDMRLVRPMPELAEALTALPKGLRLPVRLSVGVADESPSGGRSLVWAALLQGPSPVTLAMHHPIERHLKARAEARLLRHDLAVAPPTVAGHELYFAVQLAASGAPVRVGEFAVEVIRDAGRLGDPNAAGALTAELAGPGTPRILLQREGRLLEPALAPSPPGQVVVTLQALLTVLGPAGWADGRPVDVLLVQDDTLLDRRNMAWLPPKVVGALQEVSPRRILGWAALEGAPAAIQEVELRVNGLPYQVLMAAQPRPDLARSGVTAGAGGFETRLLLAASGDGDVVELRSRLTGALLGEPRTLRGLPGRVVDPARARLARARVAERRPGVSILLPLADGDAPLPCLDALFAHTDQPARLILIEDGLADPGLQALVSTARLRGMVEVVRLPAPVGRTAALNAGIAAAGRDDVVLLSPRACVGPRWLARLVQAAHAEPRLASASAIATAALPLLQASGWAGTEAARLVAHAAGGLLPALPSFDPSCAYLRREALDVAGALDEASFSADGWAADWSMRAAYLGFRHLLDEGCLVHAPSAAPVPDALLDDRYPEYARLHEAALCSAEAATVAHRVAIADRTTRNAGRRPLPRSLHVISTRTGGTPQTNRDLMGGLAGRYDTLLLHCDRHTVSISHFAGGEEVVLESHVLAQPVEALHHRSPDYDAVVGEWLTAYAVELLHVRHIAWHSLGLIEAAQALGIPTVFSFHDFYTVCPTVKLLDAEMTPCGGICTPGEGACRPDLWPRDAVPPLRNRWVHNWRGMMAPVLAACDALVTTSPGARETVLAAFPMLAERPFEVIRHGRDFAHGERSFVTAPEPGAPLRVLALGNISKAKGAELLRCMLELDIHRRIELHVAGEIDNTLKASRAFLHGAYQREDVARIVEEVQPHCGAVLSMWPETYSHTLTELWSCGVPVLGFDLGAVGERIAESGAGWLVAERTPEAVLGEMLRIASDPADHAGCVAATEVWRGGEGRRYGVAAMAERYTSLYARAGAARRAFPGG